MPRNRSSTQHNKTAALTGFASAFALRAMADLEPAVVREREAAQPYGLMLGTPGSFFTLSEMILVSWITDWLSAAYSMMSC